ncbi:11380_t:CDS:2 [Entrophospora sp. SA101]|nr:11380_t:CDS:2 [Entrophospora sp. SA101]
MHDPKLLLQELISARKAAAQFSRGSRLAIQLDKLRTPAKAFVEVFNNNEFPFQRIQLNVSRHRKT